MAEQMKIQNIKKTMILQLIGSRKSVFILLFVSEVYQMFLIRRNTRKKPYKKLKVRQL